jgi:hypothetical protein
VQKNLKKAALGLAAVLALGAAGAADAAVYKWKFVANGLDDTAMGSFMDDASGQIVSGSGAFSFTSGGVGDFKAPLYANPSPGAWSTSPDGSYYFDDLFPVTNAGLLFRGSGGQIVNIFADPGATLGVGAHTAYIGVSTPGAWWTVGGSSGEAGVFTISTLPAGPNFGGAAVPEAATWTLMLVGFGGMGAMLRARRKAPTPEAAA